MRCRRWWSQPPPQPHPPQPPPPPVSPTPPLAGAGFLDRDALDDLTNRVGHNRNGIALGPRARLLDWGASHDIYRYRPSNRDAVIDGAATGLHLGHGGPHVVATAGTRVAAG